MKTIYKYDLYFGHTSIIAGGLHARPIKFGMQQGIMCVWIEHLMMGGSTSLQFLVVGTGQSINSNYVYVDTIFDGELVWHLYYMVN
jgi:hypothetical protein